MVQPVAQSVAQFVTQTSGNPPPPPRKRPVAQWSVAQWHAAQANRNPPTPRNSVYDTLVNHNEYVWRRQKQFNPAPSQTQHLPVLQFLGPPRFPPVKPKTKIAAHARPRMLVLTSFSRLRCVDFCTTNSHVVPHLWMI